MPRHVHGQYTQSDSVTYRTGTGRMQPTNRQLANTIQPSMCGGDAAFCQLLVPLFVIWPHRSIIMRPIATDVVAWSVSL